MAIENIVSCDFDPCVSIVKIVFDCRLSGVVLGEDHVVVVYFLFYVVPIECVGLCLLLVLWCRSYVPPSCATILLRNK